MRSFSLMAAFCILFLVSPSLGASDETIALSVSSFPCEPLIFENDDGDALGIMPSILKEIAPKARWELSFHQSSWNDGLNKAKNGEIDLVTCAIKTKEREVFLDYCKEPAFTVWGSVYVRSDKRIENIFSLRDKTVALMTGDKNGDNFKDLSRQFNINCTFIEVASLNEVFSLISNGSASGGIAPNIFGVINCHKHGVIQSPVVFCPRDLFFATTKGKNKAILESIERTLKIWKKDKTSPYYKILDRWLINVYREKSVIPTWLVWALTLTIIAAAVFGLLSIMLRKMVERSDKKYKTLVKQQGDALFLYKFAEDNNHNFEEINDSAIKLYGYSRNELLELSFPDLCTSDWQEKFLQSGSLRELKKEKELSFETIGKRKDGSLFPADVKASIIETRRGLYILSTVRDMTHRKKKEELLRKNLSKLEHILFNIGVKISIVDLDKCKVLFVNNKEHSTAQNRTGDLCPFKTDAENCEYFRSRLSENGLTPKAPSIWETSDSPENRHYLNEVRFIDWVDGEQALMYVSKDITEIKELESKLRQKYKMETVGLMANGIAHDFNNLMTIIFGNIKLAALNLKSEDERTTYLEDAKTASQKAIDLVKQILTYSRKGPVKFEPINLDEIASETIQLLKTTVNIKFSIANTTSSKDSCFEFSGNRGQVQQVIMNLCTNASQAMNGQRQVELTLDTHEFTPAEIPSNYTCTGNSFCSLTVSDQGTGIEKEVLDRMYDPFYTTKKSGEGTGMGLAIVQGIVEKHGGFITVDSTRGVGTSFMVCFPGL